MTVHRMPREFSRNPIADPQRIVELVGALGTTAFARRLLDTIAMIMRVERCDCYCQRSYRLMKLASASIANAAAKSEQESVQEVRKHLVRAGTLHRIKILKSNNAQRQRIVEGGVPSGSDEVLIYARIGADAYCIRLGLCAAAPAATSEEMEALEAGALVFLAAVSKHAAIVTSKFDFSSALGSIGAIEDCIGNLRLLTGRETEVCARTLSGMSSHEIAFALGIGKESVMTYRKRAYNRLDISKQQELLIWYLDAWTNQEQTNRYPALEYA